MKKIISFVLSITLLSSVINTVGAEISDMTIYRQMPDFADEIAEVFEAGDFGTEYNEIKAFDTSSLSETNIGNYKVSTSSSNYNNVVVMDNTTKKKWLLSVWKRSCR